MASAPQAGYLLDTNILVHVIRGKTVGNAIEANFGLQAALNRSLICVVTLGEIIRWRESGSGDNVPSPAYTGCWAKLFGWTSIARRFSLPMGNLMP